MGIVVRLVRWKGDRREGMVRPEVRVKQLVAVMVKKVMSGSSMFGKQAG